MINEARKKRIETCVEIQERGFEDIMNRFDTFVQTEIKENKKNKIRNANLDSQIEKLIKQNNVQF